MQLAIRESSDKTCEDDILYGISELAIVAGPLNTKAYDSVHLLSVRHALITPRESPLAGRESIHISDLKDIPICIVNKEHRTSSSLMTLCEQEGFRPEIFFVAEYVLDLFSVAENGLSSSIVTESLARRIAGEQVCILPIDDENYLWSIYLIKSKGKQLSKPAKDLWNILERRAQEKA